MHTLLASHMKLTAAMHPIKSFNDLDKRVNVSMKKILHIAAASKKIIEFLLSFRSTIQETRKTTLASNAIKKDAG